MKKDIKKKIMRVKDRNFDILNRPLSHKRKKQIDEAINKVVKEYGETLRLLGES